MEEERWIEAEASWIQDNDEESLTTGDLFADPDPRESYRLQFGPHTIVLEGIKAENGQILNSTGLTLWSASTHLCEYISSCAATEIQGKDVLELGAGLGLCGILSHKLGANKVVLSDGDTDTLQEMRQNVTLNTNIRHVCPHTNIRCEQLIWSKRLKEFQEHFGTFDVILASDVIYVEEILEPLFATVVTLMNATGKFLLSYARRNVNIELVLAVAKCHGLQWTQPDGSNDIFVMQRQHFSDMMCE